MRAVPKHSLARASLQIDELIALAETLPGEFTREVDGVESDDDQDGEEEE